jgi:hypothetical protein
MWVLAFCPKVPKAAGSPPQMRHGASVNGCCTTNESTAKGNGGGGSAVQETGVQPVHNMIQLLQVVGMFH